MEQAVLAARADLRSAEAALRNAQAAVAQQRAALDQARLDLERTHVRAPIDGVIIGRDVDVGQTVAASLESPTLFSIAEDLRRMHVFVSIDEADISRVRVEQHAVFAVDAFPGRRFAARIIEIRKAPRIVQGVVAYTVVFSANNPDQLLMPGMTAVVEVITERVSDAVTVPNAALRFQPSPADAGTAAADTGSLEGSAATVWLLEKGGPVPVIVQIGMTDGAATEVLGASLQPGQNVVVGRAGPPERPSFLSRLFSRFRV
jgi:HlyD family secretion protein